MVIARRVFFGLIFCLLLVPFTLGYFSQGTFTVSPENNTLLTNLTNLSVYYGGTANITVEYNTTGAYTFANQTNESALGFNYTVRTENFANGTYNFRFTLLNASNRTDNKTIHWVNMYVDRLPPRVYDLTFTPNNPSSNSSTVEVEVAITDPSNYSSVSLTDGTVFLALSNTTSDKVSTIFNASFTLDQFNCKHDAECVVYIWANDTQKNNNFSVYSSNQTDPLFIDASVPSVTAQLINTTIATPNRNSTEVEIGVLWDEISLIGVTQYSVVFFRAYSSSGQLEANPSRLEVWNNSDLVLNFTNVTYFVNGSDEGKSIFFKVNLTDSRGRETQATIPTLFVNNVTPNIRVLSPPNDSLTSTAEPVQLNITEFGIGLNLTSLNVTAEFGGETKYVTYGLNSSFFTCTQDYYDQGTDIYLCNLSTSWISGAFNLSFNVSDAYGNSNITMDYQGLIVQAPEIVNLTINNQRYVYSSSAQGIDINITNSTNMLNFTWNVSRNSDQNRTGIRFLNTTFIQNFTTEDLPASVLLNVTAGKNLLIINASLNDSILVDMLYINLTANVPINLSSLSNQYEQDDMISAWDVFEDGLNITSVATGQYVNSTYDLVINLSNASHTSPYWVLLNFTGVQGLSARWNASSDVWSFDQSSPTTFAELDGISRANVTIAVEGVVDNELFFDNQRYLTTATINTNTSDNFFYYQMRNSSGELTYKLLSCGTIPTSVLASSSACYVSSGNNTVLYLPRFGQQDRIFVGTAPYAAPNITINVPETVADSIVYADFEVITPSPATSTFCWYNFSIYNLTEGNATQRAYAELTTGNFSFSGQVYSINESLIDYSEDGRYNLTINCTDSLGNSNQTVYNFTVSDSTDPAISSITSTSTTNTGTLEITTNEFTTITVNYGTSEEALPSTESNNTFSRVHRITITELDRDEYYFYNVTACDANNNCVEQGPSFFQTRDTSSSSGGGGGGGGGASGDMESSDFRYWSEVRANQWLRYEPNYMVFTSISILFGDAVNNAQLTLQQWGVKPEGVKIAPTDVYKYFHAFPRGLEGVEKIIVTFKVPIQWYTDNGVDRTDTHILRFENDEWVGYKYEGTYEDEEYYYFNASIPGFSYLAIGGKPGQTYSVTEELTDEELEQAGEDLVDQDVGQGAEQDLVEPPVQEQPKQFVSALDKTGFSLPVWAWIIIAVLVAGAVAIGGLQVYKLQQKKEEEHDKKLVQDQKAYEVQKRAQTGDPIAQVQDYIIRMKGKNISDAEIVRRLKAVGWDEIVVEQELNKLNTGSNPFENS